MKKGRKKGGIKSLFTFLGFDETAYDVPSPGSSVSLNPNKQKKLKFWEPALFRGKYVWFKFHQNRR